MNSKMIGKALSIAVLLLVGTAGTALGQGGGRAGGSTTTAPRIPRRATPRVKVTILTDPGNCQVWINGKTNGETNAFGELTVDLPGGRHKVRVVREGFVQEERTISVVAGGGRERFVLSPVLVTVVVSSDPPESEVYIDGGFKGFTGPNGILQVHGVRFGDHVIRIQRPGYLTQEQTVKVSANTPVTRLRLTPDPVSQRIQVIQEKLAANLLAEAFGIYGELFQGSPNHAELPAALERILERLQTRGNTVVARMGTHGLVVSVEEAQDLRDLYESARKFRPNDGAVSNFSDYWSAKYYFARARSAPTAPERDDNLQKGSAALARLNSANLRNAYLLYDLGWLFVSSNDRVQALRNFTAARRVDLNWDLPLFALGLLEVTAADQMSVKKERQAAYARALLNLNQAINLNPRLYHAYSLRGLVYSSLNKDREAIANAQQAVTINSLSGFAHFVLGYVYFEKGKSEYANAEREFAIALSANTDPVDVGTRKRIQELQAAMAKNRK